MTQRRNVILIPEYSRYIFLLYPKKTLPLLDLMVTSHEIPWKKRSWINRQSRAATPRSARQCSWEIIGWCGFPWDPLEAIIPQCANYRRSRGHGFVRLKSTYAIFLELLLKVFKNETSGWNGKEEHHGLSTSEFLKHHISPTADKIRLPDVKAIQVSWEEWPAPVTTYPSVPPLPPPTSWWRPRTAPNIGKTWLE